MKRMIALLTLLFGVHLGFTQDYQAEFIDYFQQGDTVKQKELLESWENESPKNPELFTCYFNYYLHKSRKEHIRICADTSNGKFSIRDSAGHVVGSYNRQVTYDRAVLQKALDKIDEGINLYPDRLDMRFGKIYALGQIADWKNFTHEIISAIQHSSVNNNNWTWTNNEKKPNGKDFFLSGIQDYQMQLYKTGDDALLENMRIIACEVLTIYPNHVESLSNLSIVYMLTDDLEKAIETDLKAEKLAPEDVVILSNLAEAYKRSEQKEKAVEYYKKVLKYGDDHSKEQAHQQINELRK